MSFPKYPKYKDSGVEWLGEVPEHWDVCRTDSVLGTCRSTVNADDLSGQTVFHYSIPVVQETGDGQLEDGTDIDSGKLVVTEPQVLVSKLNPRKGTVCIAHPREVLTVCSSEFVPLLPRRTDIRFVWYVVQSDNYRTRLESLVESATKSHQRAAPSDIYRLMWAFPPQNEQAAIAAFLDRETAKIDALIAEQQRLIELLQEKRQAVISRAVTKGLNPNAPMKDSGIEWLGEVPEHWRVARLGHCGRLQNGLSIGGEAFGTGDPFVSYGDVYNNANVPEFPSGLVRSTAEDQRKCGLEVGDVLFTRTSETVDDIGIASTCLRSIPLATFAGFLIRFRPYEGTLDPGYSTYLFRNQGVKEHFAGTMNIVTRASLSQGELRSLPICLPPLSEQREIAAVIDSQTEQLRSLIGRTEQTITLLQERRSALISAAVAGQIDLRGLAGSEAA